MKTWHTYPGRMAEVVAILPHPDRCAYQSRGIVGEDVTIKEWPSRAAMLKTIEMQERREHRNDDWRPVVRLYSGANPIHPLEQIIADRGVSISSVYGAPANPTFKDSDPWTVTLRFEGRKLKMPFYQGYGYKGAEPEAATVLSAILSDSEGWFNSGEDEENYVSDFENWDEVQADPEKRREWRKIVNSIKKMAPKVKAFLGEHYYDFVAAEQNF